MLMPTVNGNIHSVKINVYYLRHIDTEQQSLKLFEAYLQFFSTLSGHYLNYFEGTGSGKSFRVNDFLVKEFYMSVNEYIKKCIISAT